MSIATEILSLRQNQLSSITTLISALERLADAPHEKKANRLFHAAEVADIALMNIAAHAGEAMAAFQPTPGKAQRVTSMRRRSRRINSGPSTQQRVLFLTA